MSTVDEWGRAILEESEVLELFYQGTLDLSDALVEPTEDVERHNRFLAAFDKRGPLPVRQALPVSPEAFHAERTATWMLPPDMLEIDVRAFVVSLCHDDKERVRVENEMDLFEERGLVPILQLMIYLVDHFRTNKIVWGVGRGSSVASFVLFKIGVHKIDSLKYDLDFREFLR